MMVVFISLLISNGAVLALLRLSLCRWSSRCLAPGTPQAGDHLPLAAPAWAAQGLREPSLPYPARVVISGVLRWMASAGLRPGEHESSKMVSAGLRPGEHQRQIWNIAWYAIDSLNFFSLVVFVSFCVLQCARYNAATVSGGVSRIESAAYMYL